jgi:hypothetical protein
VVVSWLRVLGRVYKGQFVLPREAQSQSQSRVGVTPMLLVA